MNHSYEDWQAFYKDRVRHNRKLVSGYLLYVRQCFERGIPPVFEQTHLAALLGITGSTLASILGNAAPYYREFAIPKRRGGHRIINAPVPMLHRIQRWILDSILVNVEVHPAAHGGVQGRSILSNAKSHLGRRCLLRIDIADFFPTITVGMVVTELARLGYPTAVARDIALLCTNAGKVPQGAPTSPALSNMIMRRVDNRLEALATGLEMVYTRYFDDLYFSSDNIGVGFSRIVKSVIADSGFRVNPEKTVLSRENSPKFVTGVSISSGSPRIPRAMKRALKNEAFQILQRGISAHFENTEQTNPLLLETILGRLSFWCFIEPQNEHASKLFARLLAYSREIRRTEELPDPIRSTPLTFGEFAEPSPLG